jgi:hypothetical protein
MKPDLDPRFKRGRRWMNVDERTRLGMMKASTYDLEVALHESVKLQSHYAELLNMHDGGHRITFRDAAAWIARLRETGMLPGSDS